MLCFTPDVTGLKPSKKVNFCLVSPQNIFLKVLGIIKMLFGKFELCLCVWSAVFFSLDTIFTQCLSYCVLHAESDESLLCSWSNFCRLATSWKGSQQLHIFSIYVFHNGSYCVSLEFLINGFSTLSRLIETAVDRGMMRFTLRLFSLLYFIWFSRHQ